MAISETFVDIRAELDGLRADLNKANSMLSTQLGAGVKFSKMTAIFSGITAGLSGVLVGIKVLKGVAKTIAIPFKFAFKFIRGAAKVAIGAIKKAFTGLISIAKSVGRAIQQAFSAGRQFIGSAIDVAKDFSEQMTAVGALTSTVGTEDFTVLREKALALGSATEFSATQAAAAMANFSRTGQDVDEILSSIGPTLDFATASFLDLNEASKLGSSVMGAMGLSAHETARAMDALTVGANKSNQNVHELSEAVKNVGATAKSTGMDLEDTVGTLMAFADMSRKGGEAGTALKQVLLKLPSKNATKFFDELEVSAMDTATGGFRPLADLIEDVSAAMEGMSDFKRAGMISQAFGERAGPALTALLDAGADSIRNHTKTIEENAGMAAKNAAIQRGSFSNSFKIVASAADDLKIRLTDVLDPLIRGANERAIQALNFLSNFVRTKGPEIRDFLVGAFNVAKEKVLEALTLTVGYVSVSAEQISNKWERLKATFIGVAASVRGAAASFFGQDLVRANTGPVERTILAVKVGLANILRAFKHTIIGIEEVIMRALATGSLLAGVMPGSMGQRFREMIIGRRSSAHWRSEEVDAEADHKIRKAVDEANTAAGVSGQDLTIRSREEGKRIMESVMSGMNDFADSMKIPAAFGSDSQKTAEEIKKQMQEALGEMSAPSGGDAQVAAQTQASEVSGTISTVFGAMKTGSDQQVVLLEDILATNRLIASNTRSGGSSGFTTVGG